MGTWKDGLPEGLRKLAEQEQLMRLPELSLTFDQASWDLAASSFLRGHMRCNGLDLDDPFHRSWNSYRQALEGSGVNFSLVQLRLCCSEFVPTFLGAACSPLEYIGRGRDIEDHSRSS